MAFGLLFRLTVRNPEIRCPVSVISRSTDASEPSEHDDQTLTGSLSLDTCSPLTSEPLHLEFKQEPSTQNPSLQVGAQAFVVLPTAETLLPGLIGKQTLNILELERFTLSNLRSLRSWL